MRFSSIVAALSVFGLTTASAIPELEVRGSKCLSTPVGTEIAKQFASLLTNFNATVATNLLSDKFTDTSDSINYLAGIPLNTTTFPSAKAFIAGQGSQPPIGLQILKISAVTCDGVVVFRWVAQVGIKKFEVKGINVLAATLKGTKVDTIGPKGWQLDAVYSEFNSAAWIADLGGSCPAPTIPKE